MANTEIQASDGIISKLVDLFFKGLDNLMDSAIKYQNENGVLVGVTETPVRSKNDEDLVFVTKLSPVQGNNNIREGTFVVNFSCEGIDDLDTTVDGVDYQGAAVLITKEAKPKFEEIVNKIISQNGLFVFEDDEGDEGEEEVKRIKATSTEGDKVIVTVTRIKVKNRDLYHLEIEADKKVEHKFNPKEVTGDKIPETVGKFFEDNGLNPDSDEDDEWMFGEVAPENPAEGGNNGSNNTEGNDVSEDVSSSKKINMSLRKKVFAHKSIIELTKVYASYDAREASSAIDSILDDDKLLNNLDEGVTDLVVIDDGDDLDVQITTDPVPTENATQDVINKIYELYDCISLYKVNFDNGCQSDMDYLLRDLNMIASKLSSQSSPQDWNIPLTTQSPSQLM